jgi:uncharacterized membrane protein YoaK (UPF0700 family)
MLSDPTGASVALAGALREQIAQRIRAQDQLLVVAVAVAGVAASFGQKGLLAHPEVPALISLLFILIALALLRQDQEIAIIAAHLVEDEHFGEIAHVQKRWEVHKFAQMRGLGRSLTLATVAQSFGIYGVPVLGFVAALVASLMIGHNPLTIAICGVAFLVALLFIYGGYDVWTRYQRLAQ